ncbi:MAG TPA: PQQ-binding-like beta-propeller repeat protein, partial [Thermoanaerobaculia bacterium]|nr:PQQ-binding-like beta-propeller repeat protein [Thermoanaerobaculia bacterium]
LEVIFKTNMGSAVYSTPVAKDGVLYVTSRSKLFALAEGVAPKEAPHKEAPKPASAPAEKTQR